MQEQEAKGKRNHGWNENLRGDDKFLALKIPGGLQIDDEVYLTRDPNPRTSNEN